MAPVFSFSPEKGHSKPGSVKRTVEKTARAVRQQKKNELTRNTFESPAMESIEWVKLFSVTSITGISGR